MSIKQKIKFKNSIDFEQDQQDAMKKTENIQSLADQVERLEKCDTRIEALEAELKLIVFAVTSIVIYFSFLV